MITLYGFGAGFGLPEISPFVTKTEVQLKMAGLPYRKERAMPPASPKGQLPFIDDGGEAVADSTFIRAHIERRYGFDFDTGLSLAERAQAWAFERMIEHHVYWALVGARWVDPVNFAKGPATFFRAIPAPVRPLLVAMIRRRLRRTLHGQGIGRHSPDEIVALGTRSVDATADYLGTKAFTMGAEPTGLDATAFAFVAGALCPLFDTPLRSAAERHENLKRYVVRMTARFYPDQVEIAGCKAAA